MARKKLTVEEFNALPRNEKKVLVAKDVLAQLKAEKIIADTGNYFVPMIRIDHISKPARENLRYIKGCQVCALGACMISVTKYANHLTLGELKAFDRNRKALELLTTVFTPEEMLFIETAFEGYDDPTWSRRLGVEEFGAEVGEDILQKVNDKYYDKYGEPEDRLKAIMEDIITNNGEFVI